MPSVTLALLHSPFRLNTPALPPRPPPCLCPAEIGELLLHRVIAQFKRAYKRNDKPITIAAAKFLAHLINQGVLHEVSEGMHCTCTAQCVWSECMDCTVFCVLLCVLKSEQRGCTPSVGGAGFSEFQ